MGEAVEKIYCCDRDNNDNALAAAILANGHRDNDSWPMAAAMMNNGGWNQNQWMNNPFAYLMFLALFRNGGFGFGGDGAGIATQGIETQAQLNAIRTQLQDNQNADCIKSAIQGNGFALSQLAQTLNIDFNTLQKCCCDVQAAIQQVAGQVGFSAERVINAVNLGDCNIIQALQNCCCQTANALMPAKGYSEYVKKHGYHFTGALAEHVSKMMENANGQQHSWTTSQVKKSMESLGLTIPKHVTYGDAAYLANMYYADLYPDPLKDEASCLRAAYKIANDPDGYDGMIFCRWTADAIGKAIKLDWEKFV